jgi:hypothetical protein
VTTSVILGAGFSKSAGLPLTRELFDKVPAHRPGADLRRQEEVLAAFETWRVDQPVGDANPERWLELLYNDRDNALAKMRFGTVWADAIRFVLRRLTESASATRPYYYGVASHKCGETHRAFWETVKMTLGLHNVVTMNYDILAERALHSQTADGEHHPDWYYSGFQYRQMVNQIRDVSRKPGDTARDRNVPLGTSFPIYKLHGSVNWAWEPHSPSMKIHNDVRAAFRPNEDHGEPAVIPPVPEKAMHPEFQRIWLEAGKVLSQSTTWLICGYSLPAYDEALERFFRDAAGSARDLQRVIIIDPNSADLVNRWAFTDVEILALPALHDALANWPFGIAETSV